MLAAERGGARPGPVLRKASKVRIALHVYGDDGATPDVVLCVVQCWQVVAQWR